MKKLQATQNTYLKINSTSQASTLSEEEKLFIKKGTILEIDASIFDAGNGHQRIIPLKLNIYPDHFQEIKPQATVNPAVQRQIDRLSKYAKKPLNLNTKTKYFSQRDNYRDSHRTCNSSSNAMYLDWLMRVTGKDGLTNDNGYIKQVFDKGDTIYHGIQTAIIKDYGYDTKWMVDRDLPFVKALLKIGIPVVVNILHRGTLLNPRGGHVILLIAFKDGDFIAHDPYGTLSSNYQNHNGAYSRIKESTFSRRWQGGYRILA